SVRRRPAMVDFRIRFPGWRDGFDTVTPLVLFEVRDLMTPGAAACDFERVSACRYAREQATARPAPTDRPFGGAAFGAPPDRRATTSPASPNMSPSPRGAPPRSA